MLTFAACVVRAQKGLVAHGQTMACRTHGQNQIWLDTLKRHMVGSATCKQPGWNKRLFGQLQEREALREQVIARAETLGIRHGGSANMVALPAETPVFSCLCGCCP